MSYKLSEIIGKKYAIHVPTRELATKVEIILGNSLSEGGTGDCTRKYWGEYKKETCWSTKHSSYCYRHYFEEKKYTIISAEDFIRDNTVEKPKTFKVKGTPNLIKALIAEMEEVGYTFYKGSDITFNSINNNFGNNSDTLGKFKNMFISATVEGFEQEISFKLPKQYNEALQHAKDAINSPYWRLNEKVTIGKYTAEKIATGVKFGCQSFTKEHLEAYLSLLDRKEFNASIKVNDVEITKEMLTKLINF